jgi:hypothetical protein
MRVAVVDVVDTGNRSVGTEIVISSPSEITRRTGGRAAAGAGGDEEEEEREEKIGGDGKESPCASTAV